METKGYLTFAQNSVEFSDNDATYVDYVRLAYALALSIKATQTDVTNLSIAITPGQKLDDKYKEVFDEIIEIPWGDMAEKSYKKFQNEWKAGFITPYDKTIKLEADMIMTDSIDHWWNYFDIHDFLFTHKVVNYRNEEITSRKCRHTFDSNALPNVYNGVMYFDKNTPTALEFFKMAEMISKDYDTFSTEFLDFTRPKTLDKDTVYGLATHLTQLDDKIVRDDVPVPTFVHMKRELMNWELAYEDKEWYKCVDYWFDADMHLYVSSFKQHLPFHYQHKEFMTDDIIKKYEKYLGI